jgi:hypothetical protein
MASGENCGEKLVELPLHGNIEWWEVDCNIEPDMREGGQLGWPIERKVDWGP